MCGLLAERHALIAAEADVHNVCEAVGVTFDLTGAHLQRFTGGGPLDAPEQGMLDRLTSITADDMEPTPYDLNFYTHELDEAGRYAKLGFGPESGADLGSPDMYDVWNDVHTAALEDYRISGCGPFLSGAGVMSDAPLSDRQVKLLAVVAEGGGDWDARRIDLTVDARYGPGEGTVLRELEALQQLGLVIRDDSRSGVGGRWKVTATARPFIQ
jgi:hypothetical protein